MTCDTLMYQKSIKGTNSLANFNASLKKWQEEDIEEDIEKELPGVQIFEAYQAIKVYLQIQHFLI